MSMFIQKLIEAKSKDPINKHELNTVVASTVLEFDLSKLIDNNKLLSDIVSYRENFPKGLDTSVLAWHSDWKTHLMSDNFNELISTIESCLSKSYQHLTLVDLWINMYDGTGSAKRHNHGHAYLSCVYYVEAEEGCSSLILDDNSDKDEKIVIVAKPGKLVSFPGYMYHTVSDNKKKRTSIALNFYMTPIELTSEQIEERKKLCRGNND